jgi:hypothetical protein
MGCLKITLWVYPSHSRFALMQLLQRGFSSPHLIRRFRHAIQRSIAMREAEADIHTQAACLRSSLGTSWRGPSFCRPSRHRLQCPGSGGGMIAGRRGTRVGRLLSLGTSIALLYLNRACHGVSHTA